MAEVIRDMMCSFLKDNSYGHIHNYIVPGLTSMMLAEDPNHDGQKVRLFHSARNHQEHITPHSHRFDLACCVLAGSVVNSIWCKRTGSTGADEFQATSLTYKGEPGQYDRADAGRAFWGKKETTYHPSDWYFMRHSDVHSIQFSRDALVLIIEGPSLTDTTTIIEPVVNDVVVPTFKVEDWMFQKG